MAAALVARGAVHMPAVLVARGRVRMAAALAGCSGRRTGWTFLTLVSTNRLWNHSPPLVGAPFLDL